jgi:S-(hydroxymethyl)glutathione dehydrogenase/alcohol dehydrogenase
MKAAVCREHGKPLVIETLEIDSPQAGEVKIKIAACAICHSDIIFMDGGWGGEVPAVYGHEAAGVVAEIGPGVTSVKPGDHVVVTLIRSCGHCFYCAQGDQHICETQFPLDANSPLHRDDGQDIVHGLRTGAFAEYAVVDASQVVAIPDSIPLDSASLLACGVITGLGAVVNTAKVESGSSVVVIGTGGVGLNSVQGAMLAGARTIVAIDLSDSKLATAKAFGATHTINPEEENARSAVQALTQGRGADYVFVTVGSTTAIEQSVGYTRKGGSICIVGMPPSGAKAAFEGVSIADNAKKLIGSKMGSTRLQVDMPKLVELYQQGRLKLDELISNRYSLEQINEAVDSVRRGEALRNVIVF